MHTPLIEFPATDPLVHVVSLDLLAALWVYWPPSASCECTASTTSDIYEHTENLTLTIIPATGAGGRSKMIHHCSFSQNSPSKQWKEVVIFLRHCDRPFGLCDTTEYIIISTSSFMWLVWI